MGYGIIEERKNGMMEKRKNIKMNGYFIILPFSLPTPPLSGF